MSAPGIIAALPTATWLAVLVGAGCADSSSAECDASTIAADATGSDATLPIGCGGADRRYRGSLCGPADSSCVILADETVPGLTANSDGFPALALDPHDRPHLLFGGRYAWRMGGWVVRQAMPMATAGLVLTPTGETFALVGQQGAFDVGSPAALWERRESEWLFVEELPGHGGWPDGFIGSEHGCLHASLMIESPVLRRPAYSGSNAAWAPEPLGDPASSHAEFPPFTLPLALSDAGQPHLLYWEAHYSDEGNEWQLWWVSPPGSPERVLGVGSNVLDWTPLALAVTNSATDEIGVPHLLALRYHGTEYAYGVELVYATRSTAGEWATEVVVRGDPTEVVFERCGPGVVDCEYEYVTYRPIAAVSSGADVRLFFARYRVWSDGEGGGGVDGQLEMVWPDGGELHRQVLVTGVAPKGATAAVDSSGRIHLALADGVVRDVPATARYLLIGEVVSVP